MNPLHRMNPLTMPAHPSDLIGSCIAEKKANCFIFLFELVQIEKLTKNLLQKTATVKNTGQILRQMPQIISSLDAYMEGGLQSGLRLDTTEQMLSNMESSRIRFAFKDQ
ncbi:tobamovirus multiplication 2B isoform X3 [Wolffia australiana]